jgi:hypothetical protein
MGPWVAKALAERRRDSRGRQGGASSWHSSPVSTLIVFFRPQKPEIFVQLLGGWDMTSIWNATRRMAPIASFIEQSK